MNRFDYARPVSVAEAVAAWEPGAAYLGGGTNLVDLMKLGVLQPARLIDVNRLPGLGAIELTPDRRRADRRARFANADLAHDPAFRRRFPDGCRGIARPGLPVNCATQRPSAAI